MALGGLAVWAPLAYEDAARELVRALKFRGAVKLADWMAAQMAASAPAGWLELPSTLVPVPLHARRRRARGFNQTALLAAALERRTGLQVADCLERRGAAGSQVGRGRRERAGGPEGAIGLRSSPPPQVVLVDDVVTTGGTLAACAAALRAAGSQEVRAVVFARTLGR